MTDGTSGVARTDAESIDTKSPRHEWERGWKLVAVSLVAYVFGSAGMFFAKTGSKLAGQPNSSFTRRTCLLE
jgi:hypothetical protein